MNKKTRIDAAEQNAYGHTPPRIVIANLKTTAMRLARRKSSSQAAAEAIAAFLAKKGRGKLAAIVLGICLTTLAGCGSAVDPDRVPVFPAQGQIAYQGKPLSGAFVVLHPQGASSSNGLRPRGHVTADGKFALSTYETNDGAPAGDYKVTIECRSLVKKPSGDVVAGPNVLPKKYSRPETSPVTVRIAAGDNSLSPITLK